MGHGGRAVVISALDLEANAFCALLADLRTFSHPDGTRYRVGSIRGARWITEVAVAEIGRGNVGAAVHVERALSWFGADVVLFVGIAGSLKPKTVHLGDVVVASKVYGYQGGKATEDFLTRPVSFNADHGLEQLARDLRVTKTWLRHVLSQESSVTPRVHVEPVAAGEVLIDGDVSGWLAFLERNYNDAVAVEMEGAGFAHAAHLRGTPALVIRGISDLARDKQISDAGGWQPRAATHAAAFATELLVQLPPSSRGQNDETRARARGTRETGGVVFDGASVTIKGDVIGRDQINLFARPSGQEPDQ